MTTIQVRIDEKTKRSAKKVLDRLGVNISSSIQMYLNQIIIKKGIPFPLLTENGLTPEEERQIVKASDEAKRGKNIMRTKTWKKTKAFLDSLK